MARKPTISEIKQATRVKSPHFFDRDTLRFFGQTMSSFKVAVSPWGNIFIYARSYDRDRNMMRDRGVKQFMGYTFRQFKDGDLKTVQGGRYTTLQEVQKYIRWH
ncbi:hypothetical protein LCGC14_0510350 [marine sediment metagenome]|uniref:Uncharacterized protein n=1 Tax=marine sediment metagenome TaxID=412755 RepID=A0A0F9S694_9ZZZZ